ncbi:hypothetical protein HanRHA438_Chr17g0814791 [Helianthus annuus]|nr:hypothetical protein HanRHA438_Chr17g0814791 [Helianthus annuus]
MSLVCSNKQKKKRSPMVCKANGMCEVQVGRLKPSGFMRWAQSHPEVRYAGPGAGLTTAS